MKRTLISPDFEAIPRIFHPYMAGARVWDSSCSPQARVLFLEKEEGFYLKSAPKGSLAREAAMTRFFHEKGLAAQVLDYRSEENGRDWLLTTRIAGEDCTHPDYLADPMWLSETTATLLRSLHEMPIAGCPIPDQTGDYLALVKQNMETGNYDSSQFPDSFGFSSARDAMDVIERDAHRLRCDTLLHGDYCLPNIMLDGRRFSGFLDLDAGGVGDRHHDLFWGVWTLFFNLKTNAYADYFLDAYGRDRVEPDLLRVVAACAVFG